MLGFHCNFWFLALAAEKSQFWQAASKGNTHNLNDKRLEFHSKDLKAREVGEDTHVPLYACTEKAS